MIIGKHKVSEDKIITIWERLNINSNVWEHNHISDGYTESEEVPKPKGSVQKKSWPGGKWRKFKGHMAGTSVVVE